MIPNRRKFHRYQIPDGRQQARLRIGKSATAVQIRDESLGGFAVMVETKLPIEIGDHGLLETSRGCYQVSVVRKDPIDGEECLGLSRVKEVFGDEVAALLDPQGINIVPRCRAQRQRPPFLGMALLASVGAALIIFTIIHSFDSVRSGSPRGARIISQHVERNVAKRNVRVSVPERGAYHLAKAVKSIKLPDVPSISKTAGNHVVNALNKMWKSDTSPKMAAKTESTLGRFDRSMVHMFHARVGFSAPQMSKLLQLTEGQETDINSVLDSSLERLEDFYPKYVEQPDAESHRKMEELVESTRQQVKGALTPEQQVLWEKHLQEHAAAGKLSDPNVGQAR